MAQIVPRREAGQRRRIGKVPAFLLLCLPLAAQTFFTRTQSYVGPFERIGVRECSDEARQITGAEFYRAAAEQGIMPATYTELRAAAITTDSRSWQRNALLGVEIAGWLTTALLASDLIQVNEREWKAAAPLISGGLRLATTVIQPVRTEIPPLRPPIVSVSEGTCVESTIYGRTK